MKGGDENMKHYGKYHVYKSLKDVSFDDFLDAEWKDKYFFKEECISVTKTSFDDSNQLYVVYLDNALKRGECEEFRIELSDKRKEHTIYDLLVDDFTELSAILVMSKPRVLLKGSTVFSPFADIKRIVDSPKKWTKGHLKNLVANGQIVSAEKKGVYSDDYARDSDENYSRGNIPNIEGLISEVLESPSGWNFSEKEMIAPGVYKMSLNHYSFDMNEIIININPPDAYFYESIQDDKPIRVLYQENNLTIDQLLAHKKYLIESIDDLETDFDYQFTKSEIEMVNTELSTRTRLGESK